MNGGYIHGGCTRLSRVRKTASIQVPTPLQVATGGSKRRRKKKYQLQHNRRSRKVQYCVRHFFTGVAAAL